MKTLGLILTMFIVLMSGIAYAEEWIRVPKTSEEKAEEDRQNRYIEQEREALRQEREEAARYYEEEIAAKKCKNACSKGHKMMDVIRACGQPELKETLPGSYGPYGGVYERWHYGDFSVNFINGKVY